MAASSKDSRWWILWQILVILGSFICCSCPGFNGGTFGSKQGLYHGGISIMNHFGVARQWIPLWNCQKITLMVWNNLRWLARVVFVWQTRSGRCIKFNCGHFSKSKIASQTTANSMESQRWIFFSKPLTDFGNIWVIQYVFPGLGFNGHTFGNVWGLYHGDISIAKHFGVAHQWKSSWKDFINWLK